MNDPPRSAPASAASARPRPAADDVRLLVSLTDAIARSRDFEAMVRETLRAICEETGWDLGQAWTLDREGKALRCDVAWYAREEGFEPFREESLRWTLAPGSGLPGRVWTARSPEMVRDVAADAGFLRAASAGRVGLRSAMFVPVLAAGEPVAVLEFLVREPREHDEGLLMLVSAVAAHLGGLLLRTRVEEVHRCECDFTEAVLQTVGALVVVLDADGRILRFNRACEALTGWQFEDVRGRPVWEVLVPTEEQQDARRALQQALEGKGEGAVESTWLSRVGERRRVSWTYTALDGPPGGTASVVAAGTDVTDRRRTDERLRRAERLESVGRLAGGIAHEFNNILSAILGYGSLVMKSLEPDDPSRRDVEEVQRAAERGADLTRQLVAFSRTQALRPQLVDPNGLVEEIEPMLSRLVGKEVRLLIFPSPDLGCVNVDPGQLKQVVINLVLNAREAMSSGGYLTVKTRSAEVGIVGGEQQETLPPGRYVVLSVLDTGTGMSAEERSRVFDPFYSARDGRAGLGLAMAHGFVVQSGGEILVETESGRGTRFDVYLPQAAPASRPSVARRRAPSEWGGEESLLLVEDDPYVRAMVRRTLEGVGYRVVEAVSGEEAIELHRAGTSPFDLLLSDLGLPGMSGAELATLLRARGDGMRVLFMSGHDDASNKRRAGLEAGTEVVSKPFEPDLMLKKVRETLDRRKNR